MMNKQTGIEISVVPPSEAKAVRLYFPAGSRLKPALTRRDTSPNADINLLNLFNSNLPVIQSESLSLHLYKRQDFIYLQAC